MLHTESYATGISSFVNAECYGGCFMANTYRLILIPQYFMCGIPIWLCASAVRDCSIWLALFAIVALLVLLCVTPICRGRESLFTFLILTAMGFPVNIRVITYLWANEFLGDPFWLSGVLWSYFTLRVNVLPSSFSVYTVVFVSS